MIGNTRTALMFRLNNVALNATTEDEGIPPFMARLRPLPSVSVAITGVSRDSAGVALGGCTCTLFKVGTADAVPFFTQYATTISDGSGNYSFVVGFDGPYRVTFDLDGAPIRAGLTLKTLAGV